MNPNEGESVQAVVWKAERAPLLKCVVSSPSFSQDSDPRRIRGSGNIRHTGTDEEVDDDSQADFFFL